MTATSNGTSAGTVADYWREMVTVALLGTELMQLDTLVHWSPLGRWGSG